MKNTINTIATDLLTANVKNVNLSPEAQKIVDLAKTFNGASFIGVREYTNSADEIANYVLISNISYKNAIAKTIAILLSLKDADFQQIAEKYGVNNTAGERYSNNKAGNEYLATGKLPKEGTKAREDVLNSIKVTKTLEQVRNEMIESMQRNQDPETRSAQSEAQREAYEYIAPGIKRHLESGMIHIHAFAHSKQVIVEGEYKQSVKQIETLQKEAIERYCKANGMELPTTKFRNLKVTPEQMTSVALQGEEIGIA